MTMDSHPCPCFCIAIKRIEAIFRDVETALAPPHDAKNEVSELHDVYLHRKNILQQIDEKHVALRHLQRLESRSAAGRSVRSTRHPRPALQPNTVATSSDAAGS